jgi:hypothetical protein
VTLQLCLSKIMNACVDPRRLADLQAQLRESLFTMRGSEDLTGSLPRELDAIKALMRTV